MKNKWIFNSHITLAARAGFLNADNPGNGSSGCFLFRITVNSKAAQLPNLNANFYRVIAGKNSRAAVLKKQDVNPGSSPGRKKVPPVRFWKPSDDLQKYPVDLQKLSVGLQNLSVDLQKCSAGLQNLSVDLQKYSANLQKLSAGLQNLSVGLQKCSAGLQKLSVELQKCSASLQNLSVDLQKLSASLQKYSVEFKTDCEKNEKPFDVLKIFPDNFLKLPGNIRNVFKI